MKTIYFIHDTQKKIVILKHIFNLFRRQIAIEKRVFIIWKKKIIVFTRKPTFQPTFINTFCDKIAY